MCCAGRGSEVPHWDTSEEWEKARRMGYTPTARAEVWLDGEHQTTLEVTGGTVTCDETSKVRRTLSLPTSNVELDPRDAADLLAPFGTELAVYAGMQFAGQVEEVPVGVFSIETTGRGGWSEPLTLTGFDRAGVLGEARFLQPWNTLSGTPVVEEIAAMILSVLPLVEVLDLTGSEATTRAATWDRDRWDAIGNLAAGIGAEVFFDQMGRAVIRDVPTVAALIEFGHDPLLIHANRDDSDLLDVATAMSRADVYNAVVASSDQDVPVTAIAYQATGPLRYRHGFQKPRFYSTPVVTTYDGIAQAAASMLAKSMAYSRKVDPEVLPDAAMDAGSLVTLTLPDEQVSARIASAFVLPLGLGSMALQTRVDPDVALTDDTGTLD
jgi:hypothetical protein